MPVSDVIRVLRGVLVYEERVGRLAEDVADVSRQVREELTELRGELRQLDRRVSRIEGGIAVLQRLQGPE